MIKFSKVLPAGSYYIGDLCYIIPAAAWGDLCDQWFKDGADSITAIYNSKECYAFNTAYGDGTYPGSDGFNYPVDAGIIGIISADSVTLKNPGELDEAFTLKTFESDFTISTDGETLIFGDLVIETGDEEEDDDDYWPDEDEDEDIF